MNNRTSSGRDVGAATALALAAEVAAEELAEEVALLASFSHGDYTPVKAPPRSRKRKAIDKSSFDIEGSPREQLSKGDVLEVVNSLGPQWTKVELDRFLAAYRAYGKDWDTIADALDSQIDENTVKRTSDMIQALYFLNQSYLSLPDATGSGLYMIMKDHYDLGNQRSILDITTAKLRRKLLSKDSKGTRRRSLTVNPKFVPLPRRTILQGCQRRKVSRPQLHTPFYEVFVNGANVPGNIVPFRRRQDQHIAVEDFLSCEHMNGDDVISLAEARLVHCLNSRVQRWAIHEWFYSGLDESYFRQFEFESCLEELGIDPFIRLTRIEWSYVRSLMGSPRRHSPEYFKRERDKLQRYRTFSRCKLGGKPYPSFIDPLEWESMGPLQPRFSVGQKVVARHPSRRELHVGSVLTVDGHTYRIQFDRTDLGVELVADTWVGSYGVCGATWNRSIDVSEIDSFAENLSGLGYKDAELLRYQNRTSHSNDRWPVHIATVTDSGDICTSHPSTDLDLRLLAAALRLLRRKNRLVERLRTVNNEAERLIFQRQHKDAVVDAEAESASAVSLSNSKNLNQKISSNNFILGMEYPPTFSEQYLQLIIELDGTNRALEPILDLLQTRTPAEVLPPFSNKRPLMMQSTSSNNSSNPIGCPELIDGFLSAASVITEEIRKKLVHVMPPNGPLDILSVTNSDTSPVAALGPCRVLDRIARCVSILMLIKDAINFGWPPHDVASSLESIVASLRPLSSRSTMSGDGTVGSLVSPQIDERSRRIFLELEECISKISSGLTSIN